MKECNDVVERVNSERESNDEIERVDNKKSV